MNRVQPPVPITSATLHTVAGTIVHNVGQINVGQIPPARIVFVFEETHISPAGQIEIAIMLNRLYEDYGLRYIGLESAFTADGPLQTGWLKRSAPFRAGDPMTPLEETLVQLLAEGELSSSEMLALTYGDSLTVVGTEKAEEHAYNVPEDAHYAIRLYLFHIAAVNMTQDTLAHFDQLYTQGRVIEAVDYAISSDEWAKAQAAWLTDGRKIPSAEEELEIIDNIVAKAKEVRVEIPDELKTSLQALRRFFELASQRSLTMVNVILEIANHAQGRPVAMIIGAAHTQRVVQLLQREGVYYVVLRGNSLETHNKRGNLPYDAFERKRKVKSGDSAGMLGAFLDGRIKPRAVINEPWLQSKTYIYRLAHQLAIAAQAATPDFAGVLAQLPPPPGVAVNLDSIVVNDGEVIFNVTAINQNGQPVPMWGRAAVNPNRNAQPRHLSEGLSDALQGVQNRLDPNDSRLAQLLRAAHLEPNEATVAQLRNAVNLARNNMPTAQLLNVVQKAPTTAEVQQLLSRGKIVAVSSQVSAAFAATRADIAANNFNIY